MPGRHGKQRVKKNRSKRSPLQPMEKLVKQSWINRQSKETTILNDLMPVEKVEVKKANSGILSQKPSLTSTLKSVKAASATKNIGDNNITIPSVATTKKNLSEENWMTKDRYAKKKALANAAPAAAAVVSGESKKSTSVVKQPLRMKDLTPKQKEFLKNKKLEASIKNSRNAAQDLLNSLAFK